MPSKLNVMLVDDNEQDARAIKTAAAEYSINIKHFFVWNQAKEELENNFLTYDGVIIDYRGQIDQDYEQNDLRHLSWAIKDLEVIKTKRGYLPYVVHTGFREKAEEHLKLDCPVFIKSNHEEMLQGLRKLIEESPRSKLKYAYPIVFYFAEKYFSPHNIELLYKTVGEITTAQKGPSKMTLERKDLLRDLRTLNEALVDTIVTDFYPAPYNIEDYLEKIKRENPPRKRNVNEGNRSIRIIDFFFDSGEISDPPDYIRNAIKNIYYTASTYASHSNDKPFFPSSEMIQGLLFSHLGCYEWFNEIIQD